MLRSVRPEGIFRRSTHCFRSICFVAMTTRLMNPYIGGTSVSASAQHDIRSPYDGSLVGQVGLADEQQLEAAISGATAAFKAWSRSPTHERAQVLEKLASSIEAEQDDLARLITLESGKPLRYAQAEVTRAVSTFRLGAAEARVFGGEVMPSDQLPGAEGRL